MPDPVHGTDIGAVVGGGGFHFEVLERALDGDSTIGGPHSGRDGRAEAAVELFEDLELFEHVFCNGGGGQLLLQELEERGLLGAVNGI